MEQSVLTNEMATLSKLLQHTMLNKEAFLHAVEKGFIVSSEDGKHLQWTLGNNTLLAYFCGRMWCGDRGVFSKHMDDTIWQMGTRGVFPAKELNEIFGIVDMKDLRRKRKFRTLPKNFQLVDNLFSMQQ